MNESCLLYMSHVSYTYESCLLYMSHVSYIYKSCLLYRQVRHVV